MDEFHIAGILEDDVGAYYYVAQRRRFFEKKQRIYIFNSAGNKLSRKDINPGWVPKWVVANATAGILALQRKHETALWFLDKDAICISNNIDKIIKQDNNIIFQIIKASVNSVLLKRPLSPVLRNITAQFSESVISSYCAWLISKLNIIDVSHELVDDIASLFNLLEAKNDSRPPQESELGERLSQVIGNYKIFFEAVLPGKITIPDPFSAGSISSTHSIYVNNYLLAYYFETAKGPMLLIGFGASLHIPFAAYFPLDDVFAVTTRPTARTGLLRDFFPQFVVHVLATSDVLVDYLKSKSCVAAPMVFIDHIGHHLWNELSGLSRATEDYGLQSVSSFYVLWPDKGEHFGKVEDLFGLNCTVTRVRDGSFPQCLYERREFCLRLTGYFITKSLQDRLLSRAFVVERDFANKISALIQRSDLAFLVSFRFENRSWLNQKEEVIQLIGDLLARNKKIFLAFDGHNAARDGGLYRSHEEKTGSTFLEQEMMAANEIEAAFSGKIVVCNNIGGPVERSLILARLTELFIAPWGAALAKYKWAAGARGLIASNVYAITVKGDRKIYEDPRYVEGAQPDIWLSVPDVVDFSAPEGRRYFSAVEKRDRVDFETTSKSLSKLIFREYFAES